MNIHELMAEDAATKVKIPTNADLASVADLADKLLYLEGLYRDVGVQRVLDLSPSVPELEEALKRKKEELSKIKELHLPEALANFGLSEIKLLDGSKVTVKDDVYAGITEENREAAFSWLSGTGNEGIIKNEVKLPFGKGQDAEAKQLIDILNDRGYSFTNSRGVHPQTLRAFVRKQLEEGKPIPMDVFSVHIKKVASIKLAK